MPAENTFSCHAWEHPAAQRGNQSWSVGLGSLLDMAQKDARGSRQMEEEGKSAGVSLSYLLVAMETRCAEHSTASRAQSNQSTCKAAVKPQLFPPLSAPDLRFTAVCSEPSWVCVCLHGSHVTSGVVSIC